MVQRHRQRHQFSAAVPGGDTGIRSPINVVALPIFGNCRDLIGLGTTEALVYAQPREGQGSSTASGGRYGIETKFTRAVRDLAGRFEHRLFLSATPHNGHSNSFSTLLELLDPYRFTRGVKVRGERALDDVMVRRLKADIRSVQETSIRL